MGNEASKTDVMNKNTTKNDEIVINTTKIDDRINNTPNHNALQLAWKTWKNIIDAYDSSHDVASVEDERKRSDNATNKYWKSTSNFSDGFVAYQIAWNQCPENERYNIMSPHASIGIPEP
jgi:hypothetical protein